MNGIKDYLVFIIYFMSGEFSLYLLFYIIFLSLFKNFIVIWWMGDGGGGGKGLIWCTDVLDTRVVKKK